MSLDGVSLNRRDRLIVYYILGLILIVGIYTLLYNLGMNHLEGRDYSIFRSF